VRRLIGPLLAAALAGCVARGTYDAEVRRRHELEQEIAARDEVLEKLGRKAIELERKGETADERLARLESERLQLEEELEGQRSGNVELRGILAEQQRLRAEREAPVEAVWRALLLRLDDELARGDIEVERQPERLRIRAAAGVLFAPGSAALKREGRALLLRIAGELKALEGHRITVEGHTDATPIASAAFPSNWELSAARAAGVVRLLAEAGVDPSRLAVGGYAEWRPIADNDAPDGRARNRRIEILVLPGPL
jgi:chemotaxis protein MotB